MTREAKVSLCAAAGLIAAWIMLVVPELRERGIYKRLNDSMDATGTVLIEMDQQTNIITSVSRGGSAFFGRDIKGLHVHDIMPPSYRAAHDAAIERVNKSISNGTFKPHVVSRTGVALTTRGKVNINLRVHATTSRTCYALIDPVEWAK